MSDQRPEQDDHVEADHLVPVDHQLMEAATAPQVPQSKRRGPKTPQGRQRSSRNAVSHGIFAKDLVIPGVERAEDRSAFRARMLQDARPVGELQQVLAEKMIDAAWRGDRVRRFETALYVEANEGEETFCLPPPDAVDRVTKYEAHFNRIFYQAQHELEARQQQARGEATPLARLDINGHGETPTTELGLGRSPLVGSPGAKTPKRIPRPSGRNSPTGGHPQAGQGG